MHQVRSIVCTAVILSLLSATARADVIGSAAGKPAGHDSVAERMQARGLSPSDARTATDRMAPQDLDYFSRHPDRVQVVGTQEVQNFWYESVFGGAFLVAMTALAVGIIVHNRDTKRGEIP